MAHHAERVDTRSFVHLFARETGDMAGAEQYVLERIDRLQANDPSLKTMIVPSSKLSCATVVMLATALAKNTELNTLMFDQNEIDAHGMCSLVEALKKNTGLKVFCVFSNPIDSLTAVRIASALEINATLESLVLNKNQITTRSAITIAESLEWNHRLRCIDLRSNPIELEAAHWFIGVPLLNRTLSEVYISDIPHKLAKELAPLGPWPRDGLPLTIVSPQFDMERPMDALAMSQHFLSVDDIDNIIARANADATGRASPGDL